MTRAVLALGSNMGDRLGYLHLATTQVRGAVVAKSAIYETEPVGPVAQPDFLNAVIVVTDATAQPHDWLSEAVRLETTSGRVRDVHWGPRTLDVDVISVDDNGVPITSADPKFQLPHPHAYQRAFVLIPWLDAQPEAFLPGRGLVKDLMKDIAPAVDAVRRRDDLRWP